MSFLEGLFVGRSASEALDVAQHMVEMRAELVAFADTRGEAFEAMVLELREAVVAAHAARSRLISALTRPPDPTAS